MNKQKLQEQIDTMREELAKMETELAECEKVGLKYDKHTCWHTDTGGYISQGLSASSYGATRATKELAEIASKNMVTRNKLEAYAHQIDPDWRDKIGERSYRITMCHDGMYTLSWDATIRMVGAVYMSKSTAEQICEWLNDGRIEL